MFQDMFQDKGFIKYIVIIAVILIVVFLSQQAYFRGIAKDIFLQGSDAAQNYLAKGSNWARDVIFPKINGEVQKRGDMIKNEINQEKEKISQTIVEKIKNYFSGVVDSVFHPSSNMSSNQNSTQVCPICPPAE